MMKPGVVDAQRHVPHLDSSGVSRRFDEYPRHLCACGIRRVIDKADWAFYLLLLLQSITLELLQLLQLTPVRVTTRVTPTL